MAASNPPVNGVQYIVYIALQDMANLWDVFPTTSHSDTASMNIRDMVAASYFCIGDAISSKGANLNYIFIGQLCHAVFLSLVSCIVAFASLVDHIAMIVRNSTQKQVSRIYTAAVIAMMANKQSVRNLSSMQFIGYAVSTEQLTTRTKLTIARVVDITLPFPTLIRLSRRNVFPKSLLWRAIATAMPSKILSGLARYPSFTAVGGRSQCYNFSASAGA